MVGDAGPRVEERDARKRRPSTLARTPLGDAAAAAAYEVQRVSNGNARGLKADLAVRRQWSETYASAAAAPAPGVFERARA